MGRGMTMKRATLLTRRPRSPEETFGGEETGVEHFLLRGEEGALIQRGLLELEISRHERLEESAGPVFRGESRRALVERLAIGAHEDDPRGEPLLEGQRMEVRDGGAGLEERPEEIREGSVQARGGVLRGLRPILPTSGLALTVGFARHASTPSALWAPRGSCRGANEGRNIPQRTSTVKTKCGTHLNEEVLR